MRPAILLALAWLSLGIFAEAPCQPIDAKTDAATRGYGYLTEKAYLPPDFNQEIFDAVWQVWPAELRARAQQASLEERRAMAFQRYGLTVRPGDDSGRPLQYVVDEQGNWTMNCFACHGGAVNDQVIPGLPNANFELETLTEEIRLTKLQLQQPLSRMDIGSLVMPLGSTRGTTNAVMFGVALMAFRDADLNVDMNRLPPPMVHHDMDPPAWWNFHKRSQIYIDGFAEKGHRGLMQFMLVRENGPEKFREWESDFRDVYAFLESLRAPAYPFDVDTSLATEGQRIFTANCAECHGSYGEKPAYPGRIVPLEEIDTDPVRLSALTSGNRAAYGASWFAGYGRDNTVESPEGYVAPPLDGVWASAPYFHNGSVPTLWHVLHPDERPDVWKRTSNEYDRKLGGLSVTEVADVPARLGDNHRRRQYFDTRRLGKSAAGHRFPDVLTAHEKRAVLEYLKTL